MHYRSTSLHRGILSGIMLLFSVAGASAGEYPSALSLQGFTGIMNTPTATVQKEGTMVFGYAKQRDHREPYQHQDNYLFSFGVFSFLEVGGRVAVRNDPSSNDDVSAQFKLSTAPFSPKQYPWFPSLAFGMQDLGLGDIGRFFRSTYVVGTSQMDRIRLSVGYGFGPDRMEGMFGGAELKAFDWLYLLGEYGTKDTTWAVNSGVSPATGANDLNVGLRVVTPDLFGYPVNLQGTIKSAVNKNPGTIDFSVGVQFSLGKDWHGTAKSIIPSSMPADGGNGDGRAVAPVSAPVKAGVNAVPPPLLPVKAGTATPVVAGAEHQAQKSGADAVASAPAVTAPAPAVRPLDPPVKAGPADIPAGAAGESRSRTENLRLLRDKLVADGFMHVRVGASGTDILVIEYENARYTQSQLDGMGVVLGMAVKYVTDDYRTVRLVLKQQNIRMLQISMPAGVLQSFFRDAGVTDILSDFVEVSSAIDDNPNADFLEEASFASWFRSRLVLAPRLTTYVATESGTLDYLLAFAPALYVDLWKGALLKTIATIPVSWSERFDYMDNFGKTYTDSRLESMMLFQAIKPHPNFMFSVSGGMISNEVYGSVNEAYWYSPDGSHRLGFQQGYGKDNIQNFSRTSYLGSYRYTYAPLDTSLLVTGGSFWDNDTGVRADLSRFFGDTALSFYYKYSKTTDDKEYQIGGVQLSFPLTPRRGMKPYPVQVKGADEWSYSLNSVTKSPDGTNRTDIAIGNPPPVATTPQVYYDRDRLTPEYIKNHLLRARDAYRRYVQPD